MKLKGAEILMRVLEDEETDIIFGFPGGAVIDIYDELVKSEKIKHILVRHEQGAVHAADGYARATGKPGVCLVTSGPGATNTVTGIASAYLDSIPMVVITGQVNTSLIGNDAFQEVDIVGITRPCTKHNYLVRDVKDLAKTIKEAFYIATTGRPGPVLVDIPKDVVQASTEYKPIKSVKMRSYNPTYTPNMKQLGRVIKMIKDSKQPLIFAGGGVILSNASKELKKFARKIQAPVTTSLMGLGAFPASDPLWLGMIGMHGTYRANMSTADCDLLIGIGVRFDDRVTGKISTFASKAKIVHIDIDPTSISKNIPVHTPIVGDCKITLEKLNQLLDGEDLEGIKAARKPWIHKIVDWKSTNPLAYEQGDTIKPQFVVEKLFEVTKGDAIITTEVGQNQMWSAQYFHFEKPNTFITSGGLGVMGFGLPAAIGAQVARPDATVIDIAGDGSIQMNIQEMATAIQFGLPVKIAILNNGYLGMVRQWQELFYDRCYACTRMEYTPDFVKLAEAFGAVGLRASKPDEVVPVIKKALEINKPVIMDFIVEKEEGVYPMVPAGADITEMLLV
ncbi:MAG: biosynthetic-type acetolactate synthase large subunit [Desulfobacteraceae bacterium]